MSSVRSQVKQEASSQFQGHFHIPGDKTPEEVESQIKWLLEDARFHHGGRLQVSAVIKIRFFLNCSQNRNFKKTEPFKNLIIPDVIAKLWFKGHGKVNVKTMKAIVKEGTINGPLVALVVTAVSYF
jgi:hypothetical protein